MGKAAGVAAVIVNYNGRSHLLGCVESLRAEGVGEIVVADNGSTDGSQEALAAADPEATFVAIGENLGYGSGANRGAAQTSPDLPYVLVINPDTVVHPGCMDALVGALEADPTLDLVGPRIENTDGTLYPSARTFPNLVDATGHAFLGLVAPRNRFSRRYKLLDWDHSTARRVDWVSGSAFLVRRSAFERVGGFDEGYFMYLEDVDLCWRVGRTGGPAAGGVAYEPAGRVTHVQGVSTDRHPYRMIVEHHRSLLRWAARSQTGASRALVPVIAVVIVVRGVLALAHRATAGQRLQRRLRRAGLQ